MKRQQNSKICNVWQGTCITADNVLQPTVTQFLASRAQAKLVWCKCGWDSILWNVFNLMTAWCRQCHNSVSPSQMDTTTFIFFHPRQDWITAVQKMIMNDQASHFRPIWSLWSLCRSTRVATRQESITFHVPLLPIHKQRVQVKTPTLLPSCSQWKSHIMVSPIATLCFAIICFVIFPAVMHS